MEFHHEVDEKQVAGSSMGRNASAHSDDRIGAGCNEKFTQDGFEAWAGNEVEGVFLSPAGFLFYCVARADEGSMIKAEGHQIYILGVCPCKGHFREESVKSAETT